MEFFENRKKIASELEAAVVGLLAIDDFFEKNPKFDRGWLAASLRNIIVKGSQKTVRVPFIIGPSNSGKSTYFNPIDPVFGKKRVIHRPPETSPYGLTQLLRPGMRFIYWDEYRPVEFAARGAVPVGSFLSL